MPDKFYTIHESRCNACFKKNEKEKEKNKAKKIYLILEWVLSQQKCITHEHKYVGPCIIILRGKTFFRNESTHLETFLM